jgi:hypothetical protein
VVFNYKYFIFAIFFAGLIGSGLSGCASHQERKSLNSFDERSRLYGRLLRWKEYEAAANMIRHQDESPKDVNLDDYNDLRVVEYEVKSVVVSEDKKSAVIDAEITYYFETRNRLKTIRDAQNWWYLEEAESWFLDGNLPAF